MLELDIETINVPNEPSSTTIAQKQRRENKAMATSTFMTEQQPTIETKKEPFIGAIRFDRKMIALICWFLGGIFLDGWAHNHGLVDKTFFTPWHAVLYSGYAACAAYLVVTVFINHKRGYRWQQAIPGGYELSLLGAPLFLIGGVGDLVWHTLFGFEVGIEPLLSPTHLVLAFSGLLIMSGPFRAAWRRADCGTKQGWATLFPAIISLIAILSIFTFFTSFAHPFVQTGLVTDTNIGDGDKSRGATAILLQAGILMGVILLALRRWRLPVGTMTLMLTLNIALMSVFGHEDQYKLIPLAAFSGVIADVLLWRLKPSVTRPDALRLFAFAVPVVFYLNYFVPIMLHNHGISWSIHLWLGSTVMAGIVGLALSYLLVPPRGPNEQME
jgi:hypothetical protein